mmetsp:Transcript_14262/g.33778  ORF Transcript_14262/g.33778 Transcript_14262/m.33778 type:complete len:433 (+) Transcript_14262:2441-3739(+)
MRAVVAVLLRVHGKEAHVHAVEVLEHEDDLLAVAEGLGVPELLEGLVEVRLGLALLHDVVHDPHRDALHRRRLLEALARDPRPLLPLLLQGGVEVLLDVLAQLRLLQVLCLKEARRPLGDRPRHAAVPLPHAALGTLVLGLPRVEELVEEPADLVDPGVAVVAGHPRLLLEGLVALLEDGRLRDLLVVHLHSLPLLLCDLRVAPVAPVVVLRLPRGVDRVVQRPEVRVVVDQVLLDPLVAPEAVDHRRLVQQLAVTLACDAEVAPLHRRPLLVRPPALEGLLPLDHRLLAELVQVGRELLPVKDLQEGGDLCGARRPPHDCDLVDGDHRPGLRHGVLQLGARLALTLCLDGTRVHVKPALDLGALERLLALVPWVEPLVLRAHQPVAGRTLAGGGQAAPGAWRRDHHARHARGLHHHPRRRVGGRDHPVDAA